jgi:FkbM family methyltransferase
MNTKANDRSMLANAKFGEMNFSFVHFDADDYIFNIIKRTGSFYEIDLLCSLQSFLKESDLVVDVGANIGNHTIFFAGVCRCQVIAIEPNPVAFGLLQQNVKANQLSERVRLENIAIGSTAGYGKIIQGREHNLGTVSIEYSDDPIDAIAIKSIPEIVGGEKVRLLKIDVEGLDFDVITGAHPIIERDKPIITIEARSPTEFLRSISMLEKLDYRAIGSFSFPPTHIFIHSDDLPDGSTLSLIIKNQSLDYINGSMFRDLLTRRHGELSKAIDGVPSKLMAELSTISPRIEQLHEKIEKILDQTEQLKTEVLSTVARWDERFIKQARMNESSVLLQSIAGGVASMESLFAAFRIETSRRRAAESQLLKVAQKPNHYRDTTTGASKLSSSRLQVEDVFTDTWSRRGWPYAHGRLISGGLVTAVEAGEAGFVTRLFDVEGGGLFEVTIETSSEGQSTTRRIAKIFSDDNEVLGPAFNLADGPTILKCFVPSYVRRIKIHVIAIGVVPKDTFTVRRVALVHLDPERHQRDVCEQIGAPILASLASIPSRRALLVETVNSLLLQCDRVRVFLNNYEDVPSFLEHPRVDYRRSQDWDDRGDAGKMFWLDKDAVEGYRLIVDDDLIFPPDFTEIMCAKVRSYGNRAIFAAHGILLRQPVDNYYSEKSRAAAFHFSHAMEKDTPVHIAATNAACFHSSAVQMKWSEFKHSNSADIWLALYCQKQNLPVLTPSRPQGWIRQNRNLNTAETIYTHSRTESGSQLDSSLVQDAVLRKSYPITVQVGSRAKMGALVLIEKDIGGLEARLEHIINSRAQDTELIVFLAFDHSDSVACALVNSLKVEHETHLIDTKSDAAALDQTESLMKKLRLQSVICLHGGSADLSATDHDKIDNSTLVVSQDLADIGITSLQTRRAGRLDGLMLVASENAIPTDAEALLRSTRSGADSAWIVFERALEGRKRQALPKPVIATQNAINAVFDKVIIINCQTEQSDERKKHLAALDITAEIFSLSQDEILENGIEFSKYTARPRVSVSDEIRPIRSTTDFFENYDSQVARTAYLERGSTKAIRTQDEWNYATAQKRILENSIAAGHDSILVLRDDVLFHKDIRDNFAAAKNDLPENWLMVELGAYQHKWDAPSTGWHSPSLYRTNGSAIGGHAVGIRFEIMPFLLDLVRRRDMPFDIGALSAARRAFADRCYVIYPNLIIPSFSGSEAKRKKACEFFRWELNDYH